MKLFSLHLDIFNISYYFSKILFSASTITILPYFIKKCTQKINIFVTYISLVHISAGRYNKISLLNILEM